MTHIPVLLNEVLASTDGLTIHKLFDGTFGRGGHLSALLAKHPSAKALAFDRDPEAINYGKTKFIEQISSGLLTLEHRDYRNFDRTVDGNFDFMLLDLGVSSPQLDMGHRGFSFYQEGPLDMRMNISEGATAADILNQWDEADLNRLFQEFGEIRRPYRVTRAIVQDREKQAWASTLQLAGMIERVEGWKVKGHHPATQYFMALRMAVNGELEGVQQGVRRCIEGLNVGGRLAVITFHSLEDRIVKQIFRGEPSGFPVNRKVMQAEDEELKKNPRARSAKLRVFEKGQYKGKVNKYKPDGRPDHS